MPFFNRLSAVSDGILAHEQNVRAERCTEDFEKLGIGFLSRGPNLARLSDSKIDCFKRRSCRTWNVRFDLPRLLSLKTISANTRLFEPQSKSLLEKETPRRRNCAWALLLCAKAVFIVPISLATRNVDHLNEIPRSNPLGTAPRDYISAQSSADSSHRIWLASRPSYR